MRLTLNKLKKLSPSEVSGYSKKEIVDMLKQARALYDRRMKTFEKNPSVYSPAVEKMQFYYEEGRPYASRISRNKAYNELFRLQDFFNSQTATVKGSRAVMREQDIRIFGKNALGRPRKRLTLDERTKFWATYNEFTRTYKTAEFIYGSNRVQQYLGDIITSSGVSQSLADIMANLMAELSESMEDLDYDEGDVFSGEWPS